MSRRPAYVPKDFAGRCGVFPAPTADGREPLLLAYQSRWVLDEARIKMAEKSRQIGWSWSEAYRIDRNKSRQGERLDQWVSSRDEIQARLFLDDCKAFAGLLQIGASDLGQQVIDDGKNTAYVLAFANGCRVHSMSSNPDAQAGKRGGRTLDEFALHKDPRKLYAIAYPGITWGGDLSIFSTHRGTGNFFNSLVQEVREKGNPKRVSLHRVTLQDALDAGFLYKLQRKLPAGHPAQDMDEAAYFDFIRSGCPDPETFEQEYMCVPSDDASAFLSYELIDANLWREPWSWTLDKLAASPDPLYLGFDVGRKKDLSVPTVTQAAGQRRLVRFFERWEKMRFSLQRERLYQLLEIPTIRRACLDATGLGMQLAEEAQERFGKYRVEAVTFTPAVKEELAYPVRALLEDHAGRIPDDRRLIAAFRAISKETTAAGNVRFAADRGPDGHADEFWSFALSLHASRRPTATAHLTLC